MCLPLIMIWHKIREAKSCVWAGIKGTGTQRDKELQSKVVGKGRNP